MTAPARPHSQPARATFAGWLGTAIEYYDFAIYGSAASVLFTKIFFPATDPVVGTLVSLSSFGVGYVARPLGGLLFGHLGDRIGRKSILVTTLTMMGISTVLIGLLPTYATIGIAAPILLVILRIVQGVSLGGEYSGAALMTVEHAGRQRRGLFSGLMNTGTAAGMILANAIFLLITRLPEDQLLSWGWRIPFLFSALLVGVGMLIRLTLQESPEFADVKDEGEVRRLPLVEVLRACGGRVLLVTLGTVGAGIVFTMATVFSLTYGKTELHMSTSAMLGVLLPAAVAIIVTIPLYGRLSDRIGERPLFLAGAASMIVTPFVWFALLSTGNYGLMVLGFVLLFVGYAANYAVFPVFFSQVFPISLRFSGMSIGFTVGTIAGNAFAPTIGAALLDATGGWTMIAVYMAGAALISLIAGFFLRENAPVRGGVVASEVAA
ncbi:MHS family MFS transporter [Amycolatopsis sp. K13G38]|uniref:MHS family MFS transporter n=1 Tax=Amycolatopsis acididurans TaxID=2724524 RepID=A0ABX1IW50_9PSEU|nr:MFS transporter [Amycolatopsis acididurans]NKQ51705.1 MHS family MFS transporter [Amycolatopsis acididurans]